MCGVSCRVAERSPVSQQQVSALVFPSRIARQQPAGVRGHRDPFWGEQRQRRPRLQRQIQEVGPAQLPREETQSNLRPGRRHSTMCVPEYATSCPAAGARA